MAENYDLFGNPIIEDVLLRDKFIEPPFTLLDTRQGGWQNRRRSWIRLGIKSEVGRDAKSYNGHRWVEEKLGRKAPNDGGGTSIFDPSLCEVLYHWFCPDNGTILDPFAGGSVRGIVANKLGYKYTGIDIREEQIESNYEQGKLILGIDCPEWVCGDSNKELDSFDRSFDFIFSCPPYANLEIYSCLNGDISNMNYSDFIISYESIIQKSCKLLKNGGLACFVVGEVRGKDGNYIGFVPDTIQAFKKCGMKFYNEAILINSVGTAMLRASGNMKSKKLVKIHQNILVFKKTQ